MIENAKNMERVDQDSMRVTQMRNDVETKLYDLTRFIDEIPEKDAKLKQQAEQKVQQVANFLASHPNASLEQVAKQLSQLALLQRKLRA